MANNISQCIRVPKFLGHYLVHVATGHTEMLVLVTMHSSCHQELFHVAILVL